MASAFTPQPLTHRFKGLLLGGVLASSLVFGPSARAESLPLPSPASLDDAERVEREAAIRRQRLQLHQGLALATLGSMALSAGLGLYASNAASPEQHALLGRMHMGLGGLTTGLYLGTAGLAVTAPEGYPVPREGWDAMSIHSSLGWLHAATLACTVTLGILTATGRVPSMSHGVAGGTTLGLMALSAGVIALEF